MFILAYCSRERIHNGGASEHSPGMESDKNSECLFESLVTSVFFRNKGLFLKCVSVLLPGVECRNEFTSSRAVVIQSNVYASLAKHVLPHVACCCDCLQLELMRT